MLVNFLKLSLLTLVFPLCTLAAPLNPISKRLDDHAVSGNLTKRFTGTKWTFYDVQTGNEVFCGGFHTNGEAIVALSGANMNQGLCGKSIRMTFQGVTKFATILDMCPGCPPNGLDLAQDFFPNFASKDVGVIFGDWDFADGGAPPPAPPPPPPPPPAAAPSPPPPPPAAAPPAAAPTPAAPPPEAPTPAAAPPPEATPPPPPPPPSPVPDAGPSPSPSPAVIPDTLPDCDDDDDEPSPSGVPPPPEVSPSPQQLLPPSSSDSPSPSVSPIPETPAAPSPSPAAPSPAISDNSPSSTSSNIPATAAPLGSISTSGAISVLASSKEMFALAGTLLFALYCL